jgi:acyl carrier protein
MSNTNHVNDRVRNFIVGKFPMARKRAIGAGDNLLETGVVDSLGILELVTFMEKEFSLKISDDELTAENFASIERIAAFIEAKRA